MKRLTRLITLVVFFAAIIASAASAQPQQGDSWDRQPVTSDLIASGSGVFAATFHATVSVNHATGIYLGKSNGIPILITARHVMPDQTACAGSDVSFYTNNLEKTHYTCDRLLGAWFGVELAVFTLRAQDSTALPDLGLKPGFSASISQFEALLTMGHGGEQNPQNLLTVDVGSDCYVASATGDFRFRDNEFWSMALGCDESGGDSGSPIVSRADGTLLGMVWGGHTDKPDALAHSDYLHQIVQQNSSEIWDDLNYAVPMPKIGEFFRDQLTHADLDPELRAVIQWLFTL